VDGARWRRRVGEDEGNVGEDEDGASVLGKPGAQSDAEVGVVGERVRREAVRAEDASKASSWS
jgi:hypothetical protein